jgi:hypothetical protein
MANDDEHVNANGADPEATPSGDSTQHSFSRNHSKSGVHMHPESVGERDGFAFQEQHHYTNVPDPEHVVPDSDRVEVHDRGWIPAGGSGGGGVGGSGSGGVGSDGTTVVSPAAAVGKRNSARGPASVPAACAYNRYGDPERPCGSAAAQVHGSTYCLNHTCGANGCVKLKSSKLSLCAECSKNGKHCDDADTCYSDLSGSQGVYGGGPAGGTIATESEYAIPFEHGNNAYDLPFVILPPDVNEANPKSKFKRTASVCEGFGPNGDSDI